VCHKEKEKRMTREVVFPQAYRPQALLCLAVALVFAGLTVNAGSAWLIYACVTAGFASMFTYLAGSWRCTGFTYIFSYECTYKTAFTSFMIVPVVVACLALLSGGTVL
jgi:hypothetical protein